MSKRLRNDEDTKMSNHSHESVWRRVIWELSEQSKTSLPSMLGMLLYKVPWLISLRFVGKLGSEELAAAALATTLCNVTGMSLSVGLSSAMTTLTAQARGDLMAKRRSILQNQTEIDTNNYNEEKKENEELETNIREEQSLLTMKTNQTALLPITILIRGIFIQLALVIPVGIWWIVGIKSTLLALGQGEDLSSKTEHYLRILAPGLWAYSINWTLTSWLQAIEMADIPVYAASVGLILHIPSNILFMYVFGWGYLGAAVATVSFQVIQPILMLCYLFATNRGLTRVLESTIAAGIGRTYLTFWNEAKLAVFCKTGIRQYLSLALPGIIIISEWWASEITIFLSGRMAPSPDLALDGMTIYQSINTFCFMFPMGCAIAGAARVGNYLGAGDTAGAEFSAKISVTSAAILSTMMGTILYVTPHSFIPSFFSPDEEVVAETSKTIPFLCFYLFADGVQVALNGVVKGCGRQCITMPVVVVAYWFVGVPLAYYLAFVRHNGEMYCDEGKLCGIAGLVFGMTTGTWVHMLLLLFIVVCTTKWRVLARQAKERLSEGNTKEHEMSALTSIGRDEAIEIGLTTL
jgi:MATE family multidrug resistance protein